MAARLAKMLRQGEYDTLRFTLSRLHRDSQRSSIEGMLEVLDETERSDQWIERLWQWYKQNRELPAMTVLIYGLVKHASLARGVEAGGKPAEKQAMAIREALEEAERLIDKAIAIQPDNADLLCLRIMTARGLEMEAAQYWARFRELIGVDPGHYRGHLAMLKNLKGSSVVSDEAMFKFARGRANQLPEGHPLKSLVVHAHFEKLDHDRRHEISLAEAHFRLPEVAAEIVDAWRKSLASPQYQDESRSEELSNLFAAALYLAGQPDLSRQALAMMGDHCLGKPWYMMSLNIKEQGNPGWVVQRIAAELQATEGAIQV